MVKSPYFDSKGIKRGAWSEEEDNRLQAYIQSHGHKTWRLVPIYAGLARCSKSCRLRWVNYLKPGLNRRDFTKHEHDLIEKLHARLGNKWSIIATYFPGITDNDIKNYWHGHMRKKNNRRVNKVVEPKKKQTLHKEDEYSAGKSSDYNQIHQSSNDFTILVPNPKHHNQLENNIDSSRVVIESFNTGCQEEESNESSGSSNPNNVNPLTMITSDASSCSTARFDAKFSSELFQDIGIDIYDQQDYSNDMIYLLSNFFPCFEDNMKLVLATI